MKTNRRAKSSSCSPERHNKSAQSTSTNTRHSSSAAFKVGVISLVFLIMGYQICLFIHRAAVIRIEANRDHPDTVYVYLQPDGQEHNSDAAQNMDDLKPTTPGRKQAIDSEVKQAPHSPVVQKVRQQNHQSSRRKVESFRFDPNTATLEEFMRLGFSEKQAQSIINYRLKGGRYRRPADFAKSYVVADSVFERLEPFIDIPKVDINKADSAAFDALPGIGSWFAARMVKYREELGGYGSTEQLMDIYHFDEQKYAAIHDLICIEEPAVMKLWSMSEDSLRRHPAIRSRDTAHAIMLYRKNMPKEKCTLDELLKAGVVTPEQHLKLSRCRIAPIDEGDAHE